MRRKGSSSRSSSSSVDFWSYNKNQVIEEIIKEMLKFNKKLKRYRYVWQRVFPAFTARQVVCTARRLSTLTSRAVKIVTRRKRVSLFLILFFSKFNIRRIGMFLFNHFLKIYFVIDITFKQHILSPR